jgi:DNA polymerase sigma
LVNKARVYMQTDILGFVPRQTSVSSILQGNYPEVRSASKDPKTTLDQISTSMIQLYDSKYRVTADVAKLREQCRKTVEAVLGTCTDVFPAGTRVVVFGSCANGFGSPSSDLDMCLQLPPNASLPVIGEDEENNGAAAMAKLAEKLKEVGLEDVDTVRLTARIPVLMFNYPIITPSGEKVLLDCDLSMQNPLACLNTSLLLSYATISPQTRVLVSIIKRWAKTRDINSPQFHTLSSYGYILMLLHFLTHHTTAIKGKIVPYYEEAARRGGQYLTNQPLLPNLQRMQHEWPHSPRGTAYTEMREKPKHESCSMPHPTESSFIVNTYFYRVSDQAQKDNLKQRFAPTAQSGFDSSVAILLAEFFRYYAFCFDFKKHVVSLNSNYATGLIEKEAKAESDGWSVYRQILAIEDPFETFYDVAHVLKPGTFPRVKREFAMAYSKLVDAITGNRDASWSGGKVDLHSMSGNDVVEWLCEPLPAE